MLASSVEVLVLRQGLTGARHCVDPDDRWLWHKWGQPGFHFVVFKNPSTRPSLRGIILLLANHAERFMIEYSPRCPNPLNNKCFLLGRSLGSCMLKLLENFHPIWLVALNMDLVCVVSNDLLLSFEIVENVLKPAVEILPQRSEKHPEHCPLVSEPNLIFQWRVYYWTDRICGEPGCGSQEYQTKHIQEQLAFARSWQKWTDNPLEWESSPIFPGRHPEERQMSRTM